MTLSRAIRNIAAWWNRRCAEKRLERAYPALRIINRQIVEAKRQHRKVLHLYRQKQAFMAAALKGEVR